MLATSPNQVGQSGYIPLPVHYFSYLFNKHVKKIVPEWCNKYGVIKQLRNCFNLQNNA